MPRGRWVRWNRHRGRGRRFPAGFRPRTRRSPGSASEWPRPTRRRRGRGRRGCCRRGPRGRRRTAAGAAGAARAAGRKGCGRSRAEEHAQRSAADEGGEIEFQAAVVVGVRLVRGLRHFCHDPIEPGSAMGWLVPSCDAAVLRHAGHALPSARGLGMSPRHAWTSCPPLAPGSGHDGAMSSGGRRGGHVRWCGTAAGAFRGYDTGRAPTVASSAPNWASGVEPRSVLGASPAGASAAPVAGTVALEPFLR